jgi:hypothetical protein
LELNIKLCDKRMERQWSLEQWESLAARKSIKILPVFLFPQHWPLISSGQKVARLSIQASTSTRPWNYQVANSPYFFFFKKKWPSTKHACNSSVQCITHLNYNSVDLWFSNFIKKKLFIGFFSYNALHINELVILIIYFLFVKINLKIHFILETKKILILMTQTWLSKFAMF